MCWAAQIFFAVFPLHLLAPASLPSSPVGPYCRLGMGSVNVRKLLYYDQLFGHHVPQVANGVDLKEHKRC